MRYIVYKIQNVIKSFIPIILTETVQQSYVDGQEMIILVNF
jgi:hypothetical protein